MRQICVQSLSRERFCRYGEFLNLLDDGALAASSIFSSSFFPDVIELNFGNDLPPTVSVCQLKRGESQTVSFVEYHKKTCEGILPLDTDVLLFVGLAEMGRLSAKFVEAFYVPKGTFVRLNPLIVHGSLFPVAESGHSLCLLPWRTFVNDMEAKPLSADEAFELIVQ